MRFLIIPLLALVSIPSIADGHSIVGVKCNPIADRLVVYYQETEEGEVVSPKRNRNEWRSNDFLGPPAEGSRGDKREVTRICMLGHGAYTVRIFPDEDNPNVNGECASSVSLVVDILRGTEWILVRHRLNSTRCNERTGVITTRIVLDARSKKPRLTQVPFRAARVPPNKSFERTREGYRASRYCRRARRSTQPLGS